MALLGLALAIATSGWAVLNDAGGRWMERIHEISASIMLAVAGVHVAGVLFASWIHQENLIGAMFTGRKPGRPEEAMRSAWRSVAALMLVAVLCFWWLQWQAAPFRGGLANAPVASARVTDHARDED